MEFLKYIVVYIIFPRKKSMIKYNKIRRTLGKINYIESNNNIVFITQKETNYLWDDVPHGVFFSNFEVVIVAYVQ